MDLATLRKVITAEPFDIASPRLGRNAYRPGGLARSANERREPQGPDGTASLRSRNTA